MELHASWWTMAKSSIKMFDNSELKTHNWRNTIYRVEEHLVYSLPITNKEISYATRVGPALSRALGFVKKGWPQHVEDLHLQLFFNRQFELSVEQDCLLWGLWVIKPPGFRKTGRKSWTQVTQALCRRRKRLVLTYGGRKLIRKLNKLWESAAAVNKLENHQQWLL